MDSVQDIKRKFGIIGNTPALNRAVEVAVQVAGTDLSVLVSGESGTGKEIFPQVVHAFSHRKHGKYIAVNCGAIPEGTIDSELFGHKKGAFTGAMSDRKGYFEVADGGTIFLDEVGELPLSTQVRLLRVLETGEFIRVGSSEATKVDVRVVAATNVNLPESIKKGKFREDLFYRLNTVPISMVPLRTRGSDISLLFKKFASDFAEKYKMPPVRLTAGAKEMLEGYDWPGNVRQLKNITEQISIIETERIIDHEALVRYLPYTEASTLPTIYGDVSKSEQLNSEREILYKVLFDMKNDMNELKALVRDLIKDGVGVAVSEEHSPIVQKLYNGDRYDLMDLRKPNITRERSGVDKSFSADKNIDPDGEPDIKSDYVHEAEEVVEETLSLEKKEIELIKIALDKYGGKRKRAAQELGISERTLYRKIKEHNI